MTRTGWGFWVSHQNSPVCVVNGLLLRRPVWEPEDDPCRTELAVSADRACDLTNVYGPLRRTYQTRLPGLVRGRLHSASSRCSGSCADVALRACVTAARAMLAAAHQPRRPKRVRPAKRAVCTLLDGRRRKQAPLRQHPASAPGVGLHRSGTDAIGDLRHRPPDRRAPRPRKAA